MLKLAAFADEISPNLDEQIRVCKENRVTHIELRGVNKINVLDFDEALKQEIRSKLQDNGMGICSIGSPIGKVAIDKPWSEHLDRFKKAVELAEFFQAPFVRLFSYYPAGGEGKGPILPHRNEIIDRFRQKVEYLKNHHVTLVHENEKGIYGEKGPQCLDLMKSVDSPKLRTAFDFANFVLCGDKPQDNWPGLKPYTVHFHIKDAKFNGQIVPAGEGDGQIGPILADAYKSGYRGFMTMEPHLKVAGHSHGETGPELFKVAVDAIKSVCKRNGIPIAGAAS